MSHKITFREFTKEDVGPLKNFNCATFPLKYSDSFYQSLLLLPELTRLAFDGNDLIGAICTRTENQPDKSVHLYIMTIGIKPAYRGVGLGKELMREISQVEFLHEVVESIYLHVHEANTEAISFYQKLGFLVERRVPYYYPRLDPPHGFILRTTLPNLCEVFKSIPRKFSSLENKQQTQVKQTQQELKQKVEEQQEVQKQVEQEEVKQVEQEVKQQQQEVKQQEEKTNQLP
eukprot:c8629_g1_i1.p1 GENE.c8629_g1_i1~~c8629_g1_i1.p1  ORF type:complete len:231 (+),score=100.54 c8629_g1_i1:8-700(+)